MSENDFEEPNNFEDLDLQKLQTLLRVVEQRVKAGEETRAKTLDEQEAEELSRLPCGVAGLRARSNVNAKYQILRYGPRIDGSLAWLAADREKNKLVIPDTDSQIVLMAAYKQAVAAWRGNIQKVSSIQAQFRAKGLKGI